MGSRRSERRRGDCTVTNPLDAAIDPYKIIHKLVQQNANLNLQIVSLGVALEEEVAKNSKGGVADGDTKHSEKK